MAAQNPLYFITEIPAEYLMHEVDIYRVPHDDTGRRSLDEGYGPTGVPVLQQAGVACLVDQGQTSEDESLGRDEQVNSPKVYFNGNVDVKRYDQLRFGVRKFTVENVGPDDLNSGAFVVAQCSERGSTVPNA
jgi:hypothetical protein